MNISEANLRAAILRVVDDDERMFWENGILSESEINAERLDFVDAVIETVKRFQKATPNAREEAQV